MKQVIATIAAAVLLIGPAFAQDSSGSAVRGLGPGGSGSSGPTKHVHRHAKHRQSSNRVDDPAK